MGGREGGREGRRSTVEATKLRGWAATHDKASRKPSSPPSLLPSLPPSLPPYLEGRQPQGKGEEGRVPAGPLIGAGGGAVVVGYPDLTDGRELQGLGGMGG